MHVNKISRSLSKETSASFRWKSVRVFVFINTEPEKEKEVLQRLRGTRNVEEAYMLYGTYDVVAVIKVDAMENLNQIYTMIKRIEGVQSATTMIVIEGKN